MKWNFERIAFVRECFAYKTGFINRTCSSLLSIVSVDSAALTHPACSSPIFYMQVHPVIPAFDTELLLNKNDCLTGLFAATTGQLTLQ